MKRTNGGSGGENSFFGRIVDSKGSRFRIRFWIEIGLSIGLFFYYWLGIHPEYIQFARQPVFFLDKNFFLGLLQLPGGLLDYVAAFLTESFQFGILGAAILAILTFVFYFLLKSILRLKTWWIALLFPTIILAALQTDPNYNIVKTLALIVGMLAFLTYRSMRFVRKWLKAGVVVALMVAVYMLSPFALLLFVFLSVMHELSDKSEPLAARFLLSGICILIALMIPWITQAEIFLESVQIAFLRHSPLWVSDLSDIPPLGKTYFELILTLSLLTSAGIFFFRPEDQRKAKPSLRVSSIQGGIALAALLVSFWQVVDRNERELLSIRYAGHMGEWDRTLSYINRNSSKDLLALFHFVRAYYHTDRLSTEFQWLKQNVGPRDFFLKSSICYEYPLDYSDFLYELGAINESKHWAFEALTHYGESAEVLKRLALAHLIEGNFSAAHEFLSRLRQNPFSSSWADHYLACIDHPINLREEGELQRLHSLMPKSDFVVNENRPDADLRSMLNQFPRNDMAYQYLLMHDLLSGNVNFFTNDYLQLRMNAKVPIPRLYEEALVAFLSSNPSMDTLASRIGIQKETVDRFKAFYGLIAAHHGDIESVYPELSQAYGDTYWFYLLRAVPN